MNFEDYLFARIRELKQQRLTDKEIAALADLSQSHVNRLINGEQSFGSVALSRVLNLFPEVREVLEEHFCKGEGSGAQVVNSVVGNRVGGNITINAAPPADARLDAALDAVLADPDICDQCRLAVLRHIRAAAHS